MLPPTTQRHLPAWQRVAEKALSATEAAIDANKAADAQKYAITSGIATEKCLLLEGQATQIVQVDHYRRDLPAMFQRLITNAAAVGVTIDTAQLALGTTLAPTSERLREVSSSSSKSVVVVSSVLLNPNYIHKEVGVREREFEGERERKEPEGYFPRHVPPLAESAGIAQGPIIPQEAMTVLSGIQVADPSSSLIVGSKMNERSSNLLPTSSAVVAAPTRHVGSGKRSGQRSDQITRRVTRPVVQSPDSFDVLGDV